MRNEDMRATEAALAAIRRIGDPHSRAVAARELELHLSRTVITLRAIQDDSALEALRRDQARAVPEDLSRRATDGYGR